MHACLDVFGIPLWSIQSYSAFLMELAVDNYGLNYMRFESYGRGKYLIIFNLFLKKKKKKKLLYGLSNFL